MTPANEWVAATKGAFYTIVKPEEVVHDGKLPDAITKLGWATVDAFATFTDSTNNQNYCAVKGKKYACASDSGEATEGDLPKVLIDAGFEDVNGITVLADQSIYVAKNGVGIMGIDADSKVVMKKQAYPDEMKKEGFDKIDAFTYIDKKVIFLKGDKYLQIDENDAVEVGPIPSVIGDKKYLPAEGFSIDKDGIVYVIKGGKVLAVKMGEVTQEKAPLPAALADSGFDKVDAMGMAADGTMCFTRGGHYMCIKDDIVTTPKTAFPEELTKNGFTSADGMSFSGSSEDVCISKGDKYMCSGDTEVGKLSDLPLTYFQKDLDGFTILADGSVVVTKGGYYGVIDSEGKASKEKTPLPGTLTDALCDRETDVIVGKVELSGLSGVDEKKQIKAMKDSLAEELGVDANLITVSKDGSYTVVVSSKSKADVEKKVAAVKKDATSLAKKVATETGVDASKVTATVTAESKKVEKGGGGSTSGAAGAQAAKVTASNAKGTVAMNAVLGLMPLFFCAVQFFHDC
jgi:hypothetical protein